MATSKQITRVREAAKALELAEQNLIEAKREFNLSVKDLEGKAKKDKLLAAITQNTSELILEKVGISDSILAIIRSDPTKVWGYAEIKKRLPDAKMDSIRALLPRLVTLGKATKEGRGKFKYNGLV